MPGGLVFAVPPSFHFPVRHDSRSIDTCYLESVAIIQHNRRSSRLGAFVISHGRWSCGTVNELRARMVFLALSRSSKSARFQENFIIASPITPRYGEAVVTYSWWGKQFWRVQGHVLRRRYQASIKTVPRFVSVVNGVKSLTSQDGIRHVTHLAPRYRSRWLGLHSPSALCAQIALAGS